MNSLLAKTLVVLAVAGGLTACGSGDTVKSLNAFCDAKVTFQRVQQDGTVGDFGPALKAFTSSLPENATAAVSTTAKQMSTSWDALYATYKRTGGDPSVKLLINGTPPPDIAGMRAEWTKELTRAKVKAVYTFADEQCSRDR